MALDHATAQPDSTARAARPRVVMMVANDFVHDTRVFKEARSLIEWGCEVHVLAMARAGLPAEEVREGIRICRLPMPGRLPVKRVLIVLGWWSRGLLGRLVPPMATVPAPPADPARLQPDATAAAQRAGPAVDPPPRRPLSQRSPGDVLSGLFVRIPTRGLRRARAVVRRGWRVGLRTARRAVRAAARGLPRPIRVLDLNIDFARRALWLEPDVIQSHDLNTLPAGLIVRRLRGAPLVYDSHELFLERNISSRSRRLDKLVWAPIERFGIRRCDAVLSVAQGICRHLEKQYGIPRAHLVRNVQPYAPPAGPSNLLADELGIPRGRAVVLYPGAITVNRGLEAMIDSAPHLDRAVYVIMGYARNPQYLAQLKQRAADLGQLGERVFFRDAVPMEQVVVYTASADLGIVPTQNVCLSYFYESSNKIFHSLMAGVPLVMSDHAEKRMIVEDHGVGVLFDETDPRAIADAVNRTLADREAWEAMRRRCLRAARTLNWEHEEHTLRTIFATLLGDRAPAVPPVVLPPAPTSSDSAADGACVVTP